MRRVLYVGTKNASSWSMRAWLALREQGLAFDEHIVELRHPGRLPALAKIAEFSAPGAVPVLVDGDTVIYDSIAIMEYASELGEHPLLPTDKPLRAHTRSLVAWMHSGLSSLCGMLSFESVFYPSRKPVSDAAREQADRLLAVWSAELAKSGGPYLVGELSLADLAFVPAVMRLTAHGIELEKWPHVAEWAARLMARPSVLEWMGEAEALPPVYLEDDA